MEIILVLIGILALAAFIFILVEYPYYLVSLFVFMHLYNFNLEMPGPLDLRGLISVILIIRLLVIDKNNIDLIRKSFSNSFLILIIIFGLYSAFNDFFNDVSLIGIVKSFVLNFSALLIGFLTILNGYGKKTIVLAILITGILSTGDLIYSYAVRGAFMSYKIIDFLMGISQPYNHNFFGELCGYAIITVFLLFIAKRINKPTFFILLIIYILGVVISTSRMTFLVVTVTLVLILFTKHSLNINFKKVIISSLAGVILFIIIALSYSYILSATNIKSEFADQIYWRLVEEPMSFFNEDSQKFGWKGNRVQGTMRWRIYQTLRDANVFFEQSNSVILFGLGTGGYNKIGEIEFEGTEAIQYASHNFYTNLVAENGIVGFFLFLLFFIPLMYTVIKMIKKGLIKFSLVYLIIFMFIYSIGGNPPLIGKFAFVLYGCLLADVIAGQNIAQEYK